MATIDLNNLPETVALWLRSEDVAADKRIETAIYTSGGTKACWMEPLSSEVKASLGYAFDSDVRRAWFAVDVANLVSAGDILVYSGRAYRIDSWQAFAVGPVGAQHVEATCERLPSLPAGVN